MQEPSPFFTFCPDCLGMGKQKRRIKKSAKLRYERELQSFNASNEEKNEPLPPKAHLLTCPKCKGSGLLAAKNFPAPETKKLPHLAIIGGGIGGVALAVACLHRGIPFTIYERDRSFNGRSQGYGLTLQQASKAMAGFGLFNLEKGIISTRHLVHTAEGKIVGEWGLRKWLQNESSVNSVKKSNIHISRQALRSALLEQLGNEDYIKWNHQLIDFKQNNDDNYELKLLVNDKIKTEQADIIVGADGIRSVVRNKIFTTEKAPLNYLGCLVILGICKYSSIKDSDKSLLDLATVFQTADGISRIYVMPFDKDAVMWQLSFPMDEHQAKKLSEAGSLALKKISMEKTPWHEPIPELIKKTDEADITGYPVYDRSPLKADYFKNAKNITLIGDAAHPMSPFKGQGANQALLDALSLARNILKTFKINPDLPRKNWRSEILEPFEAEMMARSSIKVTDSAAAAEFLHTEIVLKEGNEPRGKIYLKAKGKL